MNETLAFIKDRATKTLSVARQLVPVWTWQEKTLAQLQAALVALIGDQHATPPVPGQELLTSQAEQAMRAARGNWDASLDQLHRWTVQGLGLAKTRHRDDSAGSAQLAPLHARGTSRPETLNEALAWESAWAALDPVWTPLPAITLAGFRALREQCDETLQTAYTDAHAAWRRAGTLLDGLAGDLNDLMVAWYADATRVFAPGTPEGDLIRGSIPTTYTPSPAPPSPPTPPVAA